jgi:hypothetical protein
MPNELFPAELAGKRDFDYIQPKGRRLTEYEAVTCYTQPNAYGGGWQACGDFKVRPDGRPMFDPDASAVKCRDWYAYRDPNQQWQKNYYTLQSDAEKAIDRATDVAIKTGSAADMTPEWISDGLVRCLFPFAHAEYGIFRILNVAAREAMSDSLNNVLVFCAADKLRHAQAITILGLDLEGPLDGFDGKAGKDAWLNDPMWQPLRTVVEEIMAIDDTIEMVTAAFCAYETLVGEPLRRVVFNQLAGARGDVITPTIASAAISDWLRNSEAISELFDMVIHEEGFGPKNAELLAGWADQWGTRLQGVSADLFKELEGRLSELGLAERADAVAKRELARMTEGLRPVAAKTGTN